MERVLVIGAHCDDESFGMLGTLLKHKDSKDVIGFRWFSDARETTRGVAKLLHYFNYPDHELFGLRDQELEIYKFKYLIDFIEVALEGFKPTLVYCPFIADLNRDHRIVAEATMVACRPSKFKGQMWMYKIRGTTELGLRPFIPDRCEVIERDKKLSLLKKWYPDELINGREKVTRYEYFERWPRADWR